MDANKTYREKARWELHKNSACSQEQILEAAPHRKIAVWILTSYHTNHSIKKNKTCERYFWRSRGELIREVLWRTPAHGCISVGWPAKIGLYPFCTNKRWNLEDLPSAMDNSDECWGRKTCCQCDLMMMMMMDTVTLTKRMNDRCSKMLTKWQIKDSRMIARHDEIELRNGSFLHLVLTKR